MTREKMITRTIETTVCDVLAVELEHMEKGIQQMDIEINANVEEKDAKTILEKRYGEKYSIVKIQNLTHKETLMGMLESVFMYNAVVLDPETRKPIK